jgi:DHA1 family multidrug resistance protein-like MFS transporter
LPWG